MFKKALLALGLLVGLAYGLAPAPPTQAQNIQCPDRPPNDSSNACANTRWARANAGGGACVLFTNIANGCVPASGGGTLNFLRADGTWATPPGTIPIGGVLPWAGATVPPGYLLTFGQAVSRASFPQLFVAITFQPTISCTTGSPTIAVAVGTSDRVPVGTPVESSCFIAGTTVIGRASGSLTLNHNSISTTSTTAVIFPWGNGDGSTTFNLPNLVGRTPVGRTNMSGSTSGILSSTFYGVDPSSFNAIGGSQSDTLTLANLPNYTLPISGLSFTGNSGSVSVTSTSATVAFWGDDATISSGGGGFVWPHVIENANEGSVTSTGSFTPTGTVSGTGGSINGGTTQTAFATIQPSITLDYVIKAFDVSATVANLAVGVTVITGGSNTSVLYDNAGVLGEYALATLPDMYAGTAANKLVTPSVIWPPEVVVTYGTTTTFDMSTFRDAVVTLTGNITTMTVSNVVVGKGGSITFIQDGTGSRTTVWDTKFKFAGGTLPTLTTTANAVDILSYQCRTATFCFAAIMKDVRNP